MADYLSAASLAYTLLKDTLLIAFKRSEVVRRKDFQQKVITIQKSMLEIIDNGEAILDRIEMVRSVSQVKQIELINEIKVLAASQVRTINNLRSALSDGTWYKLFELLMPDLRAKFHDPMFLKGQRLLFLLKVDNLSYEQLDELYNEQYMIKGREILSQLKETSREVSQIIREKIPLEDLVL